MSANPTSPMPSGTTESTISSLSQHLVKCVNDKQFEQLAHCYTQDAIMYGTGQPVVRGNQAVVTLWREAMQQGLSNFAHEKMRITTSESVAVEIGEYHHQVKQPDGTTGLQRGTYTVAWRREGSVWKAFEHTWSSNTQ